MATPCLRTRRVILSTGIAALLGSVVMPAPHVHATDVIKANNTTPLNDVASWVGGTVPQAADVAVWNSTVTGANTVSLGADLSFGGLSILDPGGAVTLNGDKLTLGASGINMSAATQNLTIGSNLSLGAAQTWNVASGRTLRVNGVIDGTNNALTINGSSGSSVFLMGANTFTGQTTISSGALVGLGNAAALGSNAAGSETIVQSGGTLNIGGQTVNNNPAPNNPGEEIRIAGTGVGGIGALINTTNGGNNTLAKVVLTANATISAGGNNPTSYGIGGNIVNSAGGRIDIRVNAAPTANQKHLDLAGFTLTKQGGHLLALVNADVSDGNIIVNEGQLNLESNTIVKGAADGSNGTITVNPNGNLGFWSVGNPANLASANITRPIVVNGGTIGDPTSTGAAQTVFAPISITGALNPNFTATSTTAANVTTLAGVISESGASTVTEVAKRGAGVLAFSNTANTYDAQTVIYQGTLRANYNTALGVGGVPGTATPDPLVSTDTPLGTNPIIKIAGGTLSLRINMDNNNSQQRWDMNRGIVVDMAPGTMDLDRLSNASQTDKHVIIDSLTFAAPSPANGYSIGQNQLTFNQGNTHRLEIPTMTMNSDTVLNTGDFTLNGDIFAQGNHSLVHGGGNTIQFVGSGAQEFNAFFQLAGGMRVGSGFGTPITSDTVTVGNGAIFIAPGASATFRTPTNIAAGNTIEVVSQRQTQAVVNLEQFTSVPTALRATGGGVLGVGGAAAFGDIDLSRIGDGTFRIGAGFSNSGNGTITGTIKPGAEGVVRMGSGSAATSVVTVSGTDRISGEASLEVGSQLIQGGFTTSGNGTVLLTGANNYSGGTTVNRASTLRFQNRDSLGSGVVNVFGGLTVEGAAGTFINEAGTGNKNVVNLFPGSILQFNNSAGTLNRWADTQAIALNSTSLELRGTNNFTETVGDVSFGGNSGVVVVRTGGNATLATGALTRTGRGTLQISTSAANTLGAASNSDRLTVTNASIYQAGGSEVVGSIVKPYVINATDNQFVSYGANGFQNAGFTNTVNTAAFGTLTAGTEIVNVTTAPTVSAGQDVLALRTSVNLNGTGQSINIRSGGLLTTGNITLLPNFQFATQASGGTAVEAVIYNSGTLDMGTFSSPTPSPSTSTIPTEGVITAGAGLVKFGAGILRLNSVQNISGGVWVNQGTLEMRNISNASASILGTNTITFNGTANNASPQLNLRTNVSNTYNNPIVMAADVPLAVIDVNNAGIATGTATFTHTLPSLTMNGASGPQGQTLTVSGAGTLTFAGSTTEPAVVLPAGNVTINNSVTTIFSTGGTNIQGVKFDTTTPTTLTKSGGGTLRFAAAAVSDPAVGSQMIVNAGTLELRSITAIGTAATTSIVLNGGTLSLIRDPAATYGNGTGYPVAVNGNATINADRAGAGSGQNLQIGPITINGAPTLSLTSSNGFALSSANVQLKGSPFLNVTSNGVSNQDSGTRFTGAVSGGALIKTGGGYLHLLGANNTYDGGTYVQSGLLRLRAANAAGTGAIYVNPGAAIDFNSSDNLGGNQKVIVRSNSAYPTMISVNKTNVVHPTGANIDVSAAPVGIVGLSNGSNTSNGATGVYDTVIDMGALYGGRWSLGGVSNSPYDPRYTAASLGVGADNLYRLGGGGTSFTMGVDSTGAPRNNVLSGAANSVRLGFDSANILPGAGGNYQFIIGGTNDYGGSTVIHRGMLTRLGSAATGGKSGLGSGAINVFGSLHLGSNATLNDAGTATNVLTLHPGASLVLDNQNGVHGTMGAANVGDRIADSQAISLNGALLDFVGLNGGTSTETLGDVTYSAGARIRSYQRGSGTTALTLNSLNAAAGKGHTLVLQTSAGGTLGVGDQIKITTAPTPVNGMVSSAIVNATDNTFVTYGANGLANVTYDNTFTATGALTAGMSPNAKVDINSGGTMTLADNPVVYALRTNRNIDNAGPFNQLTLRSGGLIGFGNALTINPNLVFNDGTSNVEARIYAGSAISINGSITANGVVKHGNSALVINVPQTNYASGWVVNAGDLQFSDLDAAGQSVPGNGIVVNATQTTGGLNTATDTVNNVAIARYGGVLNTSRVIFTRDTGSPELATFSGGPVKVVNEGTVRIAAADNRNLQIPAVIASSTGADSRAALTIDVPNNRFRGVIPTLTLESDTLTRVYDSGSTGDTGRITAAVVNSLVGANKSLTKIGNRTLEFAGDNSTTFTGGSITVSQGTVRVLNNGSLGSASTTATIERNATLEIAKSNFSPVGTVNQQAGSIERWNVEDARIGNYNLPAGVNLQLNTNLVSNTPRTIGLNGGSLEGFVWTDHVATAVQRTVGPAVTLNLLADSSVGQNILQGQGYDVGRAPTVNQPFGDNVTGSFLRIEGKITGAFNLTKTGLDTVTIASTGNTYNNTLVEMGVLRIGATNALPTGKTLTTRLAGTFDLNGFDQSVAGLGTADGGVSPGGVSVGSSGKIINSGITDNTLTVNNSANYTYNGEISGNVALTKSGAGTLALGAENTYVGPTIVEQGTLAVGGSISGSQSIEVRSGATLDVSAVTGGFALGQLQTLLGNGNITGSLSISGVVDPLAGPSALTASGAAAFNSGSTLSLELAGPNSASQFAANGVSLNGTVNLSIDLGFTPAANSSFILVNNTGNSAIGGSTGLFTWGGAEGVLTEGESFFVNGQGFTISYQGGTGNDVVLTAVPEPGTVMSLFGGLGVLLGMQRIRRRRN